jgi:hypothetical protein
MRGKEGKGTTKRKQPASKICKKSGYSGGGGGEVERDSAIIYNK